MDPLEKKVSGFLRARIPEMSGKAILAGVSGGADSTALLFLLNRLSACFGFSLCLCHLDHMARGEESTADADFVMELGQRLGLKTIIDRKNVPEETWREGASFQAKAREIRYRFFEDTREQLNADWIAVGHTADDQAETVLMNLIRGSGMQGLTGIPKVRGKILRPLIDCTRAEIEAYLEKNEIPFREDSSNSRTKYLRNRMRLKIIPQLEKEVNPGIRSGLVQTAKLLNDENRFQEQCLDQWISGNNALVLNEGEASVSLALFRTLHPALQRRLIRRMIQGVAGGIQGVQARHIEEALKLAENHETGKWLCFPRDCIFRVTRDRLEMIRQKTPATLTEFDPRTWELNVPGETRLEDLGLSFCARINKKLQENLFNPIKNKAKFDYEKTGEKIYVRFFQAGDRFSPLGTGGTKKLKRFFCDEHLPSTERRRVPLLTNSAGDIIWVYGLRISQKYCLTKDTRKVLVIEGFSQDR